MTMSLQILCINIQLIIFADFMLQYAVKGEYPNFRGAWLNDTHFLVAKRFYQDREYFKLEAHEVGEFNQYSGRIRLLAWSDYKRDKEMGFIILIFTCKLRVNI